MGSNFEPQAISNSSSTFTTDLRNLYQNVCENWSKDIISKFFTNQRESKKLHKIVLAIALILHAVSYFVNQNFANGWLRTCMWFKLKSNKPSLIHEAAVDRSSYWLSVMIVAMQSQCILYTCAVLKRYDCGFANLITNLIVKNQPFVLLSHHITCPSALSSWPVLPQRCPLPLLVAVWPHKVVAYWR